MGKNYVFGRAGEDEVCKYFLRKGMKIVERNFRCKTGEIDVIALDGKELVFAEVKTRRSRKYGQPLLAITKNKMRHLVRSVGYFLMIHPKFREYKLRIDAVGVLLGKGWRPDDGISGELEINHIPGIRIENVR